MPRLHTHYDNLKVARDAPPEVIKAAYRALAQRYHPDVNASPDAARIMKVLNEAYAILSDPTARRAHDDWIEGQLTQEAMSEAREASPKETSAKASTKQRSSEPAPHSSESALRSQDGSRVSSGAHTMRIGIAVALLGVVFSFGYLNSNTDKRYVPSEAEPTSSIRPPSAPAAEDPFTGIPEADARSLSQALSALPPGKKKWTEVAESPDFIALDGGEKETVRQAYFDRFLVQHLHPGDLRPAREAFARYSKSTLRGAWGPNGKPWPSTAAYLEGMPRKRATGLSSITIDNSKGGFNTYIKLCPVAPGRCDGIRHAYVPDGSTFTIGSIAPGSYEVRYQDTSTRQAARSEPISLQQVDSEGGTRFSRVRLTLFKVQDGNMNFSPLTPEEF